MLTLNYRDSRPIYGQIKDGLRRLIVTGELEAEGFIYSVPGKGSFASQTREADEARRTELLAQLRELIAELRYLRVPDSEIIALISEEVGQ